MDEFRIGLKIRFIERWSRYVKITAFLYTDNEDSSNVIYDATNDDSLNILDKYITIYNLLDGPGLYFYVSPIHHMQSKNKYIGLANKFGSGGIYLSDELNNYTFDRNMGNGTTLLLFDVSFHDSSRYFEDQHWSSYIDYKSAYMIEDHYDMLFDRLFKDNAPIQISKSSKDGDNVYKLFRANIYKRKLIKDNQLISLDKYNWFIKFEASYSATNNSKHIDMPPLSVNICSELPTNISLGYEILSSYFNDILNCEENYELFKNSYPGSYTNSFINKISDESYRNQIRKLYDKLDITTAIGGPEHMYDISVFSCMLKKEIDSQILEHNKDVNDIMSINNIRSSFSIKDVKFSGKVVIVFWEDNTKTIVRMDDEETKYDIEKALMAAYTKKVLSYFPTAKERSLSKMLDKWSKKYKEESESDNKKRKKKTNNTDNMKTASDSIIIETGGHSFNMDETPVDYIINESVENSDNKE